MLRAWLAAMRRDTNGATAVEYGLLLGLIAVGVAGGYGALVDLVHLIFDFVNGETETVANSVAAD
jgi:Flp pilus assembly pilin Flp